jgi:hypothetical protein
MKPDFVPSFESGELLKPQPYLHLPGLRFRCPLCPSPRKRLGWRDYAKHLAQDHGFSRVADNHWGGGTHKEILCAICGHAWNHRTGSGMSEGDLRWLVEHLEKHGGLAAHALAYKLGCE